jgi:4-amino-4-deoxy-L-arabinose transferase-like glycosyltransferase
MNKSVNTKTSLSIGGVVCYIVVITFSLMLALPRYHNGIDISDEGFLAYGAVRVLAGEIPNRDFVSLQPPLSFYTVAAVFKFFGTSLITLRTLGLCIYTVIILLVYAIARYLTGPILALMAAMLAATLGMPLFNFTPFAVWQGIAASLMTILFTLKFTATNQRRWAFLAGVTTALAMLSRHDQGFYLMIAVLIYALAIKLTIRKKPNLGKMLGFWAVGIAAVIVPLVIYWIICGALPYMFRQLVIFPLTTYAKTGSIPFPVFQPGLPLQANLLTGLFYLPPLIEGLVTIWLVICFIRRRFYVEHASIAFVLIISILFYCQVLTRSDLNHLLITLPPFFILLAWSMKAVSRAFNKRWISTGITFVILAIIASFLLYTKPKILPSIGRDVKAISLRRGGVKIATPLAQFMEHISWTIQRYSKPNESILCLPYQPMFYFLSERRNPTRWNYIWPGDQTTEDHQQLIEQAEANRPAVVVLFEGAQMFGYAPTIFDYVNKKYKIAIDYGSAVLYLPLDPKRQRPTE